jgi:serine/threonine protein phosphatase PrpC
VYLKRPDFYRDPIFRQFANPIPLKRPVMTAEPSVIIRELESDDLFLIFASDGLWEQLSDEAAVDIVFKSPRAVSIFCYFELHGITKFQFIYMVSCLCF